MRLNKNERRHEQETMNAFEMQHKNEGLEKLSRKNEIELLKQRIQAKQVLVIICHFSSHSNSLVKYERS